MEELDKFSFKANAVTEKLKNILALVLIINYFIDIFQVLSSSLDSVDSEVS